MVTTGAMSATGVERSGIASSRNPRTAQVSSVSHHTGTSLGLDKTECLMMCNCVLGL